MRAQVLMLSLLLAMAGTFLSGPLRADGFALVHCNLFNGSDNRIVRDTKLLVSGGRIESIVDTNAAIPAEYESIDCAGNYLMPGLFDVHTHRENPAVMRRALDSSVTSIRSASVPAFQDVGLREMVRAGALPGSDVVAAGVYLTPDLEDSSMADPRLAGQFDGVTSEDAHALGVKFATGADNYYGEQSINRISLEVMHLVRLGLSPFEALQAATVSSAGLLGMADRTGHVAPGYEADLILVPGNPLPAGNGILWL